MFKVLCIGSQDCICEELVTMVGRLLILTSFYQPSCFGV